MPLNFQNNYIFPSKLLFWRYNPLHFNIGASEVPSVEFVKLLLIIRTGFARDWMDWGQDMKFQKTFALPRWRRERERREVGCRGDHYNRNLDEPIHSLLDRSGKFDIGFTRTPVSFQPTHSLIAMTPSCRWLRLPIFKRLTNFFFPKISYLALIPSSHVLITSELIGKV